MTTPDHHERPPRAGDCAEEEERSAAPPPARPWPAASSELERCVRECRERHLNTYRDARRVREDASTERDMRELGYRGRRVCELVQNAADAAVEADASGHIELVLTKGALYAANTGAPIHRNGLDSLFYSRYSRKSGLQIGRFGLGFKSLTGLSDNPEIHSRSVSIRFDGPRAARLIREVARLDAEKPTPILRLAWTVDTPEAAAADPVLAELSAWADTVVRIPFTEPDACGRVRQAFETFPPEFLLFAQVALTLRFRWADPNGQTSYVWPYRCSRTTADESRVTLRYRNEEPVSWRVFKRNVSLPKDDETVRANTSQRNLREVLPLAWALPEKSGPSKKGQFWAFFPLEHEARITGILNAPWELNSDRTSMLPGEYNRFLAKSMATLMADHLPDLATSEDPGAPLDAWPRERGGDKLAQFLAERVWAGLETRDVVPDNDGQFHAAGDLRLLPPAFSRGDKNILHAWHALAGPAVRRQYVHIATQTGDRRPRLVQLYKRLQLPTDTPLQEPLEAVASKVPEEALHLLREVVAPLLNGTSNWVLKERIKEAKIVLTDAGELIAAKDPCLFFPRKPSEEDGDFAFVHPLLSEDRAVRTALKQLGVEELDAKAKAKVFDRTYLWVAGGSASAKWERRIWPAFRALERDVRDAVVKEAGESHRLWVRTRAGRWSDPRYVLGVPPHALGRGDLAGEDARLLVDGEYHGKELLLLERLGVRRVPDMDGWAATLAGIDEVLPGYRDHALRCFHMRLCGKRPHRGHIGIESAHETRWDQRFAVIDRDDRSFSDASQSPFLRPFIKGSKALQAEVTQSLLRELFTRGKRRAKVKHPRSNVYHEAETAVPDPVACFLAVRGCRLLGDVRVCLRDFAHLVLESGYGFLTKIREALQPEEKTAMGWILNELQLWGEDSDAPEWIRPRSPWPELFSWALLKEGEGGLSAVAAQQLYEAAAEEGIQPEEFPDLVRAGDDAVVIGNLRLAANDEEARTAGFFEWPVLVASERLTGLLCKRGALAVGGLLEPRYSDPDEPTSLTDVLWELEDVLPEDEGGPALDDTTQPSLRIVRVDDLRLVLASTSGQEAGKTYKRSCVLDGSTLYVDRAELRNRRSAVVAEIVKALRREPDYAAALSDWDGSEQARLRARIKAEKDLPDRLARAFPNKIALFASLDLAYQKALMQAYPEGGWTEREVAELALAMHGTSTLQALKKQLDEQCGLKVPGKWGGPAAIAFVTSLGFPPEFGTLDRGGPEPFELVTCADRLPGLHDYQQPIYDQVLELLLSSAPRRRALVSLPTGAGKTRIAVEAIVHALAKPGSSPRLVLWVAQKNELCEQAVRCFQQVWRQEGRRGETLRISRLWGKTGSKVGPGDEAEPHVVVATNNTLRNRFDNPRLAWLGHPFATVIDEAHHAVAPSYTQLLRWLDLTTGDDQSALIGLTATPYRGYNAEETKRLAARFDFLLLGGDVKYATLQARGVLAQVTRMLLETGTEVTLSRQELDAFERFPHHELPASTLCKLANDTRRNDRILQQLLEIPEDQQVLFFACSVDHAKHIAARLHLAGRRAACVDWKTRPAVRRHVIRGFLQRDLQVLTNFQVLATGFDAPKVDVIMIARPTFSPVLYQQMIGRGLRGPKNGGKETCRLINVLDNFTQFGDQLAFHHFDYMWE